jgi:hypothetical protein
VPLLYSREPDPSSSMLNSITLAASGSKAPANGVAVL